MFSYSIMIGMLKPYLKSLRTNGRWLRWQIELDKAVFAEYQYKITLQLVIRQLHD